ncbi:PcfJ-like protein [Bacillus phage vB_BanH_McCartney]|nr:PcfJ-like protein [Bacillus phage vB_BanH_McCartney]
MIILTEDFTTVLDRIESGELKPTFEIGHVSYYMIEKTAYSFHFYATYTKVVRKVEKLVLTEMMYDLRNKKYYIVRNGREVKFNLSNIDLIIPRDLLYGYSRSNDFYNSDGAKKFLEEVSVPENKGMYDKMVRIMGKIGEEKVTMTSRSLVRLIKEYSKLELLYKAGLNIDEIRRNSSLRLMVKEAERNGVSKIHQMFGLSKSQYKFLRTFTNNADRLYHLAEHASFLTQKAMDIYRGYIKQIEDLQEVFQMDDRLDVFLRNETIDDFLLANRVRESKIGRYADGSFFGFVFQHEHSNTYKLIEYLLFDCYNMQGLDYASAFVTYRDYYTMNTDMGNTSFNRYPRYLKTYHDIVARNYNVIKDPVAVEDFAKAADNYRVLETGRLGDYKIVVPKDAAEVVAEGNELHHCIASYVRRVNTGVSQIVFLRYKEDEDKPLVSVEIRDFKIVQAKGFANRDVNKHEKEALHIFAKRHKLGVANNL